MLAFLLFVLSLVPGWNLIGGPEHAETPAQFVAENPCVTLVFAWDNDAQRWLHWYANVPDYVNSVGPVITQMEPQRPYFIYCEGSR